MKKNARDVYDLTTQALLADLSWLLHFVEEPEAFANAGVRAYWHEKVKSIAAKVANGG